MTKLRIELTNPDAKLPQFKHSYDAGADISSIERAIVWPGSTRVFDCGLRFEIPDGFEVQIRSRSGLAAKHGIFVLNSPGTIDSHYRGPIKVILHNSSNEAFTVDVGDRIAQIVMKPTLNVEVEQVDSVDVDTDRGEGGLGSTGIK